MRFTVRLISSMATKPLLLDLASTLAAQHDLALELESVGGVIAKERVEQGEAFDLACLASDAIDSLDRAGRLVPGTIRPFALSEVAVAVRAGSHAPVLETEADLKAAVLNARSIGYSTGPSGKQLMAQFEQWGILEQLSDRLVQAKPGVPVAASIAQGEVELGFQQLSEMRGVAGIQVLGTLPGATRIQTVFSVACVKAGQNQAVSQRVLDALTHADTAALKREHGMAAP